MQQPEILSLAEKLIPAYHSEDFEHLLSQLTEGLSPSVKLLVKMELNRVMEPCAKDVDLRGRVQGECREYKLAGRTHWLDDVAFNDYHKFVKKYGGYTEGVWEALYNTRNNFRIMREKGQAPKTTATNTSIPFEVESVQLGYDLKRKENRLKLSSQIEISNSRAEKINAVTMDLSPSGARFKVPATFKYKLGETISIRFIQLMTESEVEGIDEPIEYRILGIDESYENDSVKFLRTLKVTDSDVIEKVIDESLISETQKSRHNNQDKIVRARTRAFEHIFLKHACQLPILFNKDEIKAVLLTESNRHIWKYWHDERNQQSLGGLFNSQRMEFLTKPGTKGTSATVYAFQHMHKEKKLFFSMIRTEGTPQERKLFWHLGAKRDSWRVFRLSVFELTDEDKASLSEKSEELEHHLFPLTHMGILQEINTPEAASDYLFVDKPRIPPSELNAYRQSRQQTGKPFSIFYDTRSQRKEPRYNLNSPIEIKFGKTAILKGNTKDISKRGLSVVLNAPSELKAEDKVHVHFLELKGYSKTVSLEHVPYTVLRTDDGGTQLQLVMDDSSATVKIIAFLNKLIESNLDRLSEIKELLPNEGLLESFHDILLSNVVCAPIFVERKGATLSTKAIGVTYPLEPYLMLLAKLGSDQKLSLEPIFRGHTNTLLATPMKRIDNAKPVYNEIYISVRKFGARIQSVDTRIRSDFESTQERISFLRDASLFGDIFVLRIVGLPIFNPMTSLLKKDLHELTQLSSYHGKSLEKEISNLAGYAQITDITEEVLIRLELNT
ncbi:PilZ domain-containing protein [Vibrio sp.]|nr:PilZ domain-containing protein [Vibrio sp.]